MGTAILSILKLVFAILLAPVIYALTLGFFNELPALAGARDAFLAGMITYVLLQLFFYSPQGIFQFGQKIFGDIFKSMPSLAAVLPLFIPIVPTMVLLVAFVTVAFFDLPGTQPYFIFFTGFTLAMHLILSAHAEFEEDDNALKPHYLFLISLTYIINLIIIASLLTLNFSEFSLSNIFSSAFDSAKEIYIHVFNQLFQPMGTK